MEGLNINSSEMGIEKVEDELVEKSDENEKKGEMENENEEEEEEDEEEEGEDGYEMNEIQTAEDCLSLIRIAMETLKVGLSATKVITDNPTFKVSIAILISDRQSSAVCISFIS